MALKARKAGNRPRTFHTGLTVLLYYYYYVVVVKKYPVDFADELKIGDVRYDNMILITIKVQLF